LAKIFQKSLNRSQVSQIVEETSGCATIDDAVVDSVYKKLFDKGERPQYKVVVTNAVPLLDTPPKVIYPNPRARVRCYD
jgi:hypothetical protein